MRTDEALNKIADLTPVVVGLAIKLKNSQEYLDFEKSRKEGVSNYEFMANAVPILIKNCSDELYKCLAIVFDKNEEEIRKQSFRDTVKQIREIMTDEDFVYFFKLLLEKQAVKQTVADMTEQDVTDMVDKLLED